MNESKPPDICTPHGTTRSQIISVGAILAEVDALRTEADTLRAQLAAARVVTDAMVERAARVILSRHVSYTGKDPEKAWQWYGDDFKHSNSCLHADPVLFGAWVWRTVARKCNPHR
jgi:hypothetical protein